MELCLALARFIKIKINSVSTVFADFKGDFGVKAPPQFCQQSIFGILMAPQINPNNSKIHLRVNICQL